MTIGIDISQIVHEGTGVAKYVRELTSAMLSRDQTHTYVLFGASLRKRHILTAFAGEMKTLHPSVRAVILPIPPSLLDLLWNRLHVLPVRLFIGPVDVFWSSDWTQPPLGSIRGVTTIHDVSFLRFPESFEQTIPEVQKRRLRWAKEECGTFLCDSLATKQDVETLLGIDGTHIRVVYPGYVRA